MSKTEPFATSPTVPPEIRQRLEEVWPAVQDALVRLEPRTPHILATGSDHYVQANDPDLTIGAIKSILDRVKNRALAVLARPLVPPPSVITTTAEVVQVSLGAGRGFAAASAPRGPSVRLPR